MDQARDRLIRIAERILRGENPIPVDLEARMLLAGIDMSALRRRLANG